MQVTKHLTQYSRVFYAETRRISRHKSLYDVTDGSTSCNQLSVDQVSAYRCDVTTGGSSVPFA